MTTHRLKIFVKYADAIMSGAKTFEIRKNDRDYEVGDSIVFNVVADDCHYAWQRLADLIDRPSENIERPR